MAERRQGLPVQPVFQLEVWDAGEMSGVTTHKAKGIGHGDGDDSEICQGNRRARFFQTGPELAADIGHLCIKTNDVDR